MKDTLTEKQNALLPSMVATYLLVPVQSESAQENVHKIIQMLDEPAKVKLYVMIGVDLKARLERQKGLLQQQIDQMEV